MAEKSSALSEAPPTRAPSTSGLATSSAMLPGLAEPPYSTRMPSASLGAEELRERLRGWRRRPPGRRRPWRSCRCRWPRWARRQRRAAWRSEISRPARPALTWSSHELDVGAGLADLLGLAAAEHRDDAGGNERLGLLVLVLIRLVEVVAALGVADDAVGAAGALEHVAGRLAGVGALGLPVHVLRTEGDGGSVRCGHEPW